MSTSEQPTRGDLRLAGLLFMSAVHFRDLTKGSHIYRKEVQADKTWVFGTKDRRKVCSINRNNTTMLSVARYPGMGKELDN